MNKTSSNKLMSLSNETKLLVNQGIFSLYSLAENSGNHEKYVLYTDSYTYLLSEVGEIVKQLGKNTRFKVLEAITFPEMVQRNLSFGKYNIA